MQHERIPALNPHKFFFDVDHLAENPELKEVFKEYLKQRKPEELSHA